VWSQSHGLGGAITITVTASNAGGKTSNSATITLASCQDSPPPPQMTVQRVGPKTIAQDAGGTACTNFPLQSQMIVKIDGASKASGSYTITTTGLQGTMNATVSGDIWTFQLGPIQFATAYENGSPLAVTITATSPQGVSASVTAQFTLDFCPVIG
jgi:hypothetical protein